ncbi:MOSC domain-containing protein [Rhodococcus rhodnii]|uniref:MOSC domain-containing protein n=2 Tax=Rhodococcus rhodnii TaxID=38312 RepID=R7WH45_9NOCA|nr:MOSC domain-containing protein [Rhodococcus rhodnii]EOM74396.1 hypothetical protein Rrhod_4198 [Rhodococcus rhodnii LMG 5362]TXG89110.1 MOSC domain-containing protein [Rhodococcus rhodnii]
MTALGRVVAVCVVHTERDSGSRRAPRTAIDKRPVDGDVQVGLLGLAGDHVCDTEFHGGEHKAVYAYHDDEAQRWAGELGRDVAPGWFGENLRIAGPVTATDAVVGERWRIGEQLVLEVTGPRVPCGTFGTWTGERRWVKRFTERADTGAYLRVVTAGPVRAGDAVRRIHVPDHGVTVREVFTGEQPDRLEALLAAVPDLSPSATERIDHHLSRAERARDAEGLA